MSQLSRFDFSLAPGQQIDVVIKIPRESRGVIQGVVIDDKDKFVENAVVKLFEVEKKDKCHDKCHDKDKDKDKDKCRDKCKDEYDECRDKCHDKCHDEDKDKDKNKCKDEYYDEYKDKDKDKDKDKCHDKCHDEDKDKDRDKDECCLIPITHTFTDECGQFIFGPLCCGKVYAIKVWSNDICLCSESIEMRPECKCIAPKKCRDCHKEYGECNCEYEEELY